MPRLLSLNTYNYRRGGSDVVFLEHDALFRKLGWETAVMAMHHPHNLPSPWSGYFVDEIEMGHRYGAWHKLAMAGKVVYSFEAKRKLRALLGRFRPDVAHVHGIYHHLSPSVLHGLHDRGVPVVLTAHDFKIACPAYKMRNRGGICERCRHGNLLHLVRHRCIHDSLSLSSLIFVESSVHRWLGSYRKCVDRIVVPSRFHREKLIEWGWPESKLTYVPNYVKAEEFTPRYEPGEYFLYVGRLAPEKGIATLIEASRGAGIELRVVGCGPAEPGLRELARDLPSIVFCGYQEGTALRNTIRNSRALVLPSELYENAPLSVLEALASGKPVLGARIGGIPELVVDGETGWLFESGDPESLQERLREVASLGEARLIELGRSARAFVEGRFSEYRYLDSMLGLYRELGVDTSSD